MRIGSVLEYLRSINIVLVISLLDALWSVNMLFLKGRSMFHGFVTVRMADSGLRLLLVLLCTGCCCVGGARWLFFRGMGRVSGSWIVVKECLTRLFCIVRYYLHSNPSTNSQPFPFLFYHYFICENILVPRLHFEPSHLSLPLTFPSFAYTHRTQQ